MLSRSGDGIEQGIPFPPNTSSWLYDNNGVPKLSGQRISTIATGLLAKFAPECLREPLPIPTNTILDGVQRETKLKFELGDFSKATAVDHRGVTIFSRRTIIIDRSLILDESRTRYLRFTIAHELGHWILQRHRPIYMDFSRTAADRLVDDVGRLAGSRRVPQTPEDWVEWQANQFASRLILPRRTLRVAMVQVNLAAGLPLARAGNIFINASPQGHLEARQRLIAIADVFKVSERQVMNALESCGLLERQEGPGHFGGLIPESAAFFPDVHY